MEGEILIVSAVVKKASDKIQHLFLKGSGGWGTKYRRAKNRGQLIICKLYHRLIEKPKRINDSPLD